jgi:SAM-dependent methyltransferase
MFLYSATVLVGAFLLFLVQPIISKQILPWFGGSASVWTTCLVFFQTGLLVGYLYVDFSVRYLRPRRQVLIHSLLLLGSLVVLPIIPGSQWKPSGDSNPLWSILGLLSAAIGLPYLLLATTGPLVQAWAARATGVSPYRLYALSNLASLLALLAYPVLLEPWSPTHQQAIGWSAGYALFVALSLAAGWRSLRRAARPEGNATPVPLPGGDDGQRPAVVRQLLWCTLAAAGSILLLTVTTQITRNIAAVPLLWIAPLAVYLLSFIFVFAGWYWRGFFAPQAAAAILVMAVPFRHFGITLGFGVGILTFLVGLFVTCMFVHGELARLKPPPRYLTRYYLMLALGGCFGSALAGIAAPLLLPGYFELPAGLVLCGLLLAWQQRSEPISARVLGVAIVVATVYFAALAVSDAYKGAMLLTRNFYGALRVIKTEELLTLVDGTIVHGVQLLGSAERDIPTTYYTTRSGVGRLLTLLGHEQRPLRVGLIGLGAGTLATYGRTGDTFRCYEINPQVVAVARGQFTFLKSSAATIETALGDARLTLEREAPQRFDVLAVDAFSSDAIPVHLLTREAIALYRRHLRPGGVIAFHLTNKFLDLEPVVLDLAAAQKLEALVVHDPGGPDEWAFENTWVLLATEGGILGDPQLRQVAEPLQAPPGRRLWTDDFSTLVGLFK